MSGLRAGGVMLLLASGCGPESTPIHVDLYTLAANPSDFEGRTVQVAGNLGHGEEECLLVPTFAHAMFLRHDVSAWVELRRPIAIDLKMDRVPRDMGWVLVEGVVRAGKTMGAACGIRNACILRVFPDRGMAMIKLDELYGAIGKLATQDAAGKAQARKWLVAKTGVDMGGSPDAWMEWWAENRLDETGRKVYEELEELFFE